MSAYDVLEGARQSASRYVVRPAIRGYDVWRFNPWTWPNGGWRIIASHLPSRADGVIFILHHFGLTEEQPAKALPAPASETWEDWS